MLLVRLFVAIAMLVPFATFAHAGERERRITDALIWTGLTERVAHGHIDARDRSAIVRYEQRFGGYPDGHLDTREAAILLDMAGERRAREGYRLTTDGRTGARIGLPTAWFGRGRATGEGTAWRSPDGAISIETFRSTRGLAAARARELSRGGETTYRTGGRGWFVLSGYRGGNAFYVRAEARGSEVRGYRVTYDPALRSRLDRVVVAMSSDYRAFASQPTDSPVADAVAGPPPTSAYALLPPSGPKPQSRPVELASLEPIPTRPSRPARTPIRRPAPTAPAEQTPAAPAAPAGTAAPAEAADPIPPLGPGFGPTAPEREATASVPTVAPAPRARPGLSPQSDAPVVATGEETEDAVPDQITGMLTEEGQSCPTLRAPDGTLYALVGEVPSVEPGTLVTIEAQEVATERCTAGRTVAVSGFRVRSLR